jgi:hypothetical protein
VISYILFYGLILASAVGGFIGALQWFSEEGRYETTLSRVLHMAWRATWVFVVGVFITLVITLLVVGAIIRGAISGRHDTERSETYDLRALGTSSNVEGEYSGGIFLSYGYIKEKRVLNYIRVEPNGAFVLRTIDAEDAYIFETDDPPKAVHTTEYGYDPTWFDGYVSGAETWSFYVPKGSVVNDYTVENK